MSRKDEIIKRGDECMEGMYVGDKALWGKMAVTTLELLHWGYVR